ncbi:response regulator [Croceiramulus getboli]|nr:response regulator [Flavobacteriaceae bacterium YJPT1-3]
MNKALIVDDDEIFLFLIKSLFKKNFPEVRLDTCLHGEEALDYLKNDQPDVVFLDINMPVLNGWEFMNKIDAVVPADQKLKIYIVSSSIDPRDHKIAEEDRRISGFIEKPLTAKKLEELSLDWL